MKLRKLSALVLSAVLLLGMSIAPASAAEIGVTVDGKAVQFTDAVPFVDENYRTMIPLRAVADALGCEVTWSQTMRTARVYKDDCVSEGYGASAAYNDGKAFNWREEAAIALYLHTGVDRIFYETTYELFDEDENKMIEADSGAGMFAIDTQPVARDGRIYLPIRAVAETFGYTVNWNSATSTVEIESGGAYMASVTEESAVYITAYPDWVGALDTYQ